MVRMLTEDGSHGEGWTFRTYNIRNERHGGGEQRAGHARDDPRGAVSGYFVFVAPNPAKGKRINRWKVHALDLGMDSKVLLLVVGDGHAVEC